MVLYVQIKGKKFCFETEQEFPLSHVFLFAISGYIKIGSFGFRINNFNALRDENCVSWFGRFHSVYLAPDPQTSAVPYLPTLLRFRVSKYR